MMANFLVKVSILINITKKMMVLKLIMKNAKMLYQIVMNVLLKIIAQNAIIILE